MSKSQRPIFYVYIYLDPTKPGLYVYGEYSFEYEPFYVGKGLDRRAYDHLKGSKNEDFFARIQEIQTPQIIFYEKGLKESPAHALERKLVKAIGRLNKGTGPLYNLTDAGQGCAGMILSEESKRKIGNKHRGTKASEQTRQKMSEVHKGSRHHMFGKSHSIETKQKMSEARKKRITTDETRQKMSIKRKGQIPWNKGKHASEETRQKLSIAMKNPSDETRKKISCSQKKRIEKGVLRDSNGKFVKKEV